VNWQVQVETMLVSLPNEFFEAELYRLKGESILPGG
jgi:hypothetical protein